MNGQLVNFDKLVDGGVNYPQFAMVTLLRLAACSVPLLIGLTSRCFAHWARASCAPRHCHPLQFPLKSCGFSSAETVRKRFLLWKMGFSGAAYCEPMHPSIQHGRPAALAGSLAVLPASLGLLRAVSPTGRALRAPPPYTPPGTILMRESFGSTIRHGRSASLASSLAALPASLGLLRAASPIGRALRAPLSRSPGVF